jgi:hypothetical protein
VTVDTVERRAFLRDGADVAVRQRESTFHGVSQPMRKRVRNSGLTAVVKLLTQLTREHAVQSNGGKPSAPGSVMISFR